MAVESEAEGSLTAPLSWRELLLSFRGRLSQRTYVTWVFLAQALLALAAISGLALLVFLAQVRAPTWLFRGAVLLTVGISAAAIWANFATLAKRLQDRNRNGWLALLFVIPLANLWILFEALFLRGKGEGNRYGVPESREFASRAAAITLGLTAFVVPSYVLSGFARAMLVHPFNIPSGSKEPTLLIGDYLFVSKWAYGYSRFSFPLALVPFEGRFFSSQPERGDVVVFKFPPDEETDYIERIVGLPGDRIQMRDGMLIINDVAVPKEKIDDYVEPVGPSGSGATRNVPRYRETLPNGVSYEVLDRDPEGNLDNTQVFRVPEGHYFAMGDNRDNSADSRVDVGYVPLENLVGKAEIVFFSHDGSAQIWEIWKWPFAIRYDRIGRYIE